MAEETINFGGLCGSIQLWLNLSLTAPSQLFVLFAIPTMARPGHGFQAGPRDRVLASFTNAKRALPDPVECSFDCSQETGICLMQTNLELRFLIGGGLVNRVTMPASCSWNWTFTVGVPDGQFAPFGKQHLLISVQFSSIHFQSCRIRT
jgi:hypothetical protein